MLKLAIFTAVVAVLGTACINPAGNNAGLNGAAGRSTLVGRISSKAGPWSNAEVKLTTYLDDTCRALSQSNTKLSPEEEKTVKECVTEKATTKTDAEGNFIFNDVDDGWYKLAIHRDSNEDPWKSFPWQPFWVNIEDDGSMFNLIAAKDEPKFRMSVFGKPFQFSKANPPRKDVALSRP